MSIIFGKPCFSLEDFEREMEEFLPAPDDINFLVHFEIDENNYDGSFGFDWMRDEYKNSCDNYEELKKEYIPIGNNNVWTPNNEEYFVPWISVIPNKTIQLKLKIKLLGDKKLHKNDLIRLPKNDAIHIDLPDSIKKKENGEYIEFKAKDVEEKKVTLPDTTQIIERFIDIEINCKEINKDMLYSVKDQTGRDIGKLNFFRNNEILKLDIQFVKVYADKDYDENKNKLVKDFNFNSIKNRIKDRYNQPLINLNFLELREETIDTDKFIENNVAILINGKIKSKGNVFEKFFYNEYYNNFKGIVILLSTVERHNDLGAGYGAPYPLDVHYLFIPSSSIDISLEYLTTIITHEIGHILGLYHSGDDIYYMKVLKDIINNYRNISDNIKEDFRNKIIQLEQQYSIRTEYYKNVIQAIIEDNRTPNLLKKWLINLKSLCPKFLVRLNSTRNIMEATGGENLISFWKWQWEKMRDEVKEFYN